MRKHYVNKRKTSGGVGRRQTYFAQGVETANVGSGWENIKVGL